MVLENILGITDSAELTRVEEKMSKAKAVELYEKILLKNLKSESSQDLPKFINFFLIRYIALQER